MPGDYDGDGKTDLAVFDVATGRWLIRQSRDGFVNRPFGPAGLALIPMEAPILSLVRRGIIPVRAPRSDRPPP